MATLKDTYEQRQQENANLIKNKTNAAVTAGEETIRGEYEPKISNAIASRDQIGGQYQTAANNQAIANEKQYRNTNLGNLLSGTGSGTQQQMQLANRQNFLNNYAALRKEEANATNTANQNIADLNVAYNNALFKNRTTNENSQANELMNNRSQMLQWYDNAVNTAMKNGNFSAGVDTYGQATVNQMQNKWIAENPVVAYRMGMIDANTYKQLTGKAPNT